MSGGLEDGACFERQYLGHFCMCLTRGSLLVFAGHCSECWTDLPDEQLYIGFCRSIFGTLGKIARTEGGAALWRGTEASLLITVPLIALYLPLYDTLLEGLHGAGTGMYAPLLAGSGARAVACLATAPLELLKTRLQSQPQVQSDVVTATLVTVTCWRSLTEQ